MQLDFMYTEYDFKGLEKRANVNKQIISESMSLNYNKL